MPPQDHHSLDIGRLAHLSRAELRALWSKLLGRIAPACLGRDVLALGIAYAVQERRHGGLSKRIANELERLTQTLSPVPKKATDAGADMPRLLRSGTVLVREWQGTIHQVTVLAEGYLWNGGTHRSLSAIARAITGTQWNGPRFFALRQSKPKTGESGHGQPCAELSWNLGDDV